MSGGIFTTRRGLGAAPARRRGIGALVATPTYLQVKEFQTLMNEQLKIANCASMLDVDGSFGPKTCGALKYLADRIQAGEDQTEALADWGDRQGPAFIAACNSIGPATWTPPNCPSVQRDLSQPLTDMDIWPLQANLNDEVAVKFGVPKCPETGAMDRATCDLAAFANMKRTAGQFSPTPELKALLVSAGLTKSCSPYAAAPAPTTTATLPSPSGPSAAQTLSMQKLMNSEVLGPKGFRTIPEHGLLDAVTCGAASAIVIDYRDGKLPSLSSTLKSLLSRQDVLDACRAQKPWVNPQMAVVTAPPAPAPATTTWVPRATVETAARVSGCVIDYGSKNATVLGFQKLLNSRLPRHGYQKISETSKYDAATCGAMTALKDHYRDWSFRGCPGGVDVPFHCPRTTAPKRVVKKVPPPPAPTVKRASIVGPMIVAGVIGTAAYLYAKKKGMVG